MRKWECEQKKDKWNTYYKKTGSARHQTDPPVHTAVRPFANPGYYIHEAGIFRYNIFSEK